MAEGQGALCQTLMQTAEAALRDGRLTDAESACQRILALEPKYLPALLLLGSIAANTGRAPLGVQYLREALQIEPNSSDALNGLAFLLRATGQLAEAISICERAIRLNPQDVGANLNLGTCLMTQGRAVDAERAFRRALSVNSGIGVLHFNLGLALQQSGKNQEAAEAYRRAIVLDPNVPDLHARLGQVMLALGNRKEAQASFRRATEIGQGYVGGHIQLARLLVEDGKMDEAEAQIRRAVSLDPNAANALASLGEVLLQRGQFEEAIENFERAIALQPQMVGPYVGIGQAKKISEADRPFVERVSEMLKEGKPAPVDRAGLHYTLGKAFNDLGDFENAMLNYVEANRISEGIVKSSGRAFDKKSHKDQFDQLIRTFTKEFFVRHQEFGSRSELPILIVGMPRSGTTLVEQIVSSHPKVGAGDELSFWRDDARHSQLEVLGGNVDGRKIERLAESYLQLLRNLDPNADKVTDKMTENYKRLGLIHLTFPNARIIYCRRNSVDNCLSIYMTPYGNPPDFAYDRENIVFAYEQHLRLMDHWREVLPPDRLMEVSYEILVDDREGVTRQVIDFCGLDWDDLCLRPEENERAIRTPSLWQARQPVYKTSVERWRRYEPWLGEFEKLIP